MAVTDQCDHQVSLQTTDVVLTVPRTLLCAYSPVFAAQLKHQNTLTLPFDSESVSAFLTFCGHLGQPGEWMKDVQLVQTALPVLQYAQAGLEWARFVLELTPDLDAIFDWESLVGCGHWSPSVIQFLVDHSLRKDFLHNIEALTERCTPETLVSVFRHIATAPVRFQHGAYEVSTFRYKDRMLDPCDM